MLLKAYELGIGTCWVCRLPSQKSIKKMFNVPNNYDVIAYIALGYPDQDIKRISRKYKLDEVVSVNTFKGKVTKGSIKRQVYLMVPRPIKLFARLCLEGRFWKRKKK